MRINKNWLLNILNISVDIEKLAIDMTNIGFETKVVNKNVIDFNIPPNRGDCISVFGILRELSALYNKEIDFGYNFNYNFEGNENSNFIKIENCLDCSSYLGRLIKNINNSKKIPSYITSLLIDSGINSVSSVVDLSNYVMLEFGFPFHIFDNSKIYDYLFIRSSHVGENLLLNNDNSINFSPKTLIISDSVGPLSLAGIIGGKRSFVNIKTKDVFVECAVFNKNKIRFNSRKYKINTESSYRFERLNFNINLQKVAFNRLISLIEKHLCGTSSSCFYKLIYKNNFENVIFLYKIKLKNILGFNIDDHFINDIFFRLKFNFEIIDLGWKVFIPNFRHDLKIDVDLIEEVIRFYGIDKINLKSFLVRNVVCSKIKNKQSLSRLYNYFINIEFNEVITYSFIPLKLNNLFIESKLSLNLINPLSSSMSTMRCSLFPGLLNTLYYNKLYGFDRCRFFEIGFKFFFDTNSKVLSQKKILSGVCTGNLYSEQWGLKKKKIDFFDIKNYLEFLYLLFDKKIKIKFLPIKKSYLEYGESAAINVNGINVGFFGSLNLNTLNNFDLHDPVFVFEADLDFFKRDNQRIRFKKIIKFPVVRRDLSFLVDINVNVYDIINFIFNKYSDFIIDIFVFDVYKSNKISLNNKSISLGLFLQNSKGTFTDDELIVKMKMIIDILIFKFNIILRN